MYTFKTPVSLHGTYSKYNPCVCVFFIVWLQWLLGVCAVVSLLKSGISGLHLITASRNMAAIDLAERESERSKDK